MPQSSHIYLFNKLDGLYDIVTSVIHVEDVNLHDPWLNEDNISSMHGSLYDANHSVTSTTWVKSTMFLIPPHLP